MLKSRVARIAISVWISFVASLISFVTIAMIPFYVVNLPYSRQEVYDAPAHGGAIFLLTVPIAAAVSVSALLGLFIAIYRLIGTAST